MELLTLEKAKIIAEKEFGTSKGLCRFFGMGSFVCYRMCAGRCVATITAIPFPEVAIAARKGLAAVYDVGTASFVQELGGSALEAVRRYIENDPDVVAGEMVKCYGYDKVVELLEAAEAGQPGRCD